MSPATPFAQRPSPHSRAPAPSVLTKLDTALGGWRPSARSVGGDPLDVIRAAWAGIVGADVARSAQPIAIQQQTLVIVTASSAWSAQLTFLAPTILREIRALPQGEGVQNLRFRVGVPRAAGSRRTPGSAPPRRRTGFASPATSAPAATPAEALARLRSTVERTRAAHAAKGGRFCTVCAVSIEPGPRGASGRCVPCADTAHAVLVAATERLLFESPWLTPEAVITALPGLDATSYDAIRRRLLRAWWDEMALARRRAAVRTAVSPDRLRLRKLASSYVLLETKIDPHRLELESPVRRNALGDLYEFIRSVEAPEKS
jgi:hypothetical protein